MRLLVRTVLSGLLLLYLAACSGRNFVLLQPGQGPGTYSGTLSGDATGDLSLRVRDSGQISGSGVLSGFEIELRGVLQADGSVVAFITERETQRSGEFDGLRSGTQLSGTWRLDPTGQSVLTGAWSAVLNP